MRSVYLVRHALPDIPIGARWCVGHTDLSLGTVGRMQAALLPFVPVLRGKPVFCSYLSRAIDTARPLCAEPMIREGLEEQDMGIWDGLSFDEIMVRYPALYAAREKDPNIWPESAEDMVSCAAVWTKPRATSWWSATNPPSTASPVSAKSCCTPPSPV